MATIASPRPAPSSHHSDTSLQSANDQKLTAAALHTLGVPDQSRRQSTSRRGSVQQNPASEHSSSGTSSPKYSEDGHDADPVAPLHSSKRPGLSGRLSRMFSHRGDQNPVASASSSAAAALAAYARDTSTTRPRAASNLSDAGSMSENDHPTTNGHGHRPHANGDGKHQDGRHADRPPIVAKSSTFGTFKKDDGRDDAGHPKRRFYLVDDGASHEHCLKADKRQETLTALFKNMFKRADANPAQDGEHGLSLASSWVDQVRSEKDRAALDQKGGPNCAQTLVEKYGKCQEVVGRGAFGIVRISHKADANDPKKEKLYAVKEFRRRPSESPKKYNKRLTSEFCISSALRHPNVIHTLDLLQDAKGDFCEVMEYCSGGDLYTLVLAAVKLEVLEADCYFKQLMRGVEYIHEMGVAHRDLKPENLLLTSRGALKITDFGNGECFRMAWEKEPHMVAGLCGSAPYIAPEEYTDAEFDPRAIDVWACGVIYMAMRTGRHLWRLAKRDEDDFYDRYCEGRKGEEGYGPIESLHRSRCRNVMYSVLDPNPRRRITASQVLKSEWGREIHVCKAGEEGF